MALSRHGRQHAKLQLDARIFCHQQMADPIKRRWKYLEKNARVDP